jgi:hypothetical protein
MIRRYFIALLKCVPIVILLSNSGDSTAGRCKVVGIIVWWFLINSRTTCLPSIIQETTCWWLAGLLARKVDCLFTIQRYSRWDWWWCSGFTPLFDPSSTKHSTDGIDGKQSMIPIGFRRKSATGSTMTRYWTTLEKLLSYNSLFDLQRLRIKRLD